MDELIFTIAEVSEILKLSPQSVRKLMKSKELEFIVVGKSYRISKKSLFEYINKKQD